MEILSCSSQMPDLDTILLTGAVQQAASDSLEQAGLTSP